MEVVTATRTAWRAERATRRSGGSIAKLSRFPDGETPGESYLGTEPRTFWVHTSLSVGGGLDSGYFLSATQTALTRPDGVNLEMNIKEGGAC